MNPSPAMSQKCHGVQANRLNLLKPCKNPHKLDKHCCEKTNSFLGKPKIQNKTNETKKHIRKNKKTKFLTGSNSPLDIFFGLFLDFLNVFTKHIFWESYRYKRKPQKTNTHLRKNKTTKFLNVSDSPLDMFFGFPESFYKTKQTFEKIQNARENQRKQKTLGNIKKQVFKGFRFTLGCGFLYVFPEVFTKPCF